MSEEAAMDERQWSKARNLASAYSEAYDEDVALVLGEALLEALAELLVPEDEKHESLPEYLQRESQERSQEEAKAQHPAFLTINPNQCASRYINYFCQRPSGHGGAHRSSGIDDSSASWGNGLPEWAKGQPA